MIRSILQHFIIVLLTIMLIGCISQYQKRTPQVIPIKSDNSIIYPRTLPPFEGPLSEKVPKMPDLRNISWHQNIKKLVLNMIRSVDVTPGDNILLVNSIKNSTNGILQLDKITMVIRKSLANNGKFTLIPISKINEAKYMLGLSMKDELNSLNKAIGLARIVNAKYMLYSNALGKFNSPTLKMQLILVKTGEIIWSGDNITSI
ncbi:penicillin-binding protein activator LpoB [Pantoea sp. Mhis]|uniref:penicillin-binding protein activator LpoB n=1 Tax=Pantoea sp. Mhis TaxID=2576759 RepID=UPI0013581F62|nr:penicillin-binding protein activator LpoB [Pantoea sp. Mhis]MXP56315.1 penicillin-binding protein activator LpoB [Pantoea sp. Mhis]